MRSRCRCPNTIPEAVLTLCNDQRRMRRAVYLRQFRWQASRSSKVSCELICAVKPEAIIFAVCS
jgi:hypothetical protein